MTGAASGIGRATAQRLASEGARVLCADLDPEGAAGTVESVEREGGAAAAATCNVTEPEDAARAVAAALDRFGGLDVLVNSAGVGSFQHFTEISAEEWRHTLEVNLTGTFLLCQAAIPDLLKRPGAAIVNVASLAGLRGQAYTAAYCASKAGVVSLTRCLAVEYAKSGLRVNCVCPSGVGTPLLAHFQPPKEADPDLLSRLALVPRLVSLEEVAGAIAYLASEDSTSLSGVALPLDHGTAAG